MKHYLSNIDLDTNMADCAVCGRVKLWRKGFTKTGQLRRMCSNKATEEKQTPNAKLLKKRMNWRTRGVIISNEEIETFYNATECECCGATNVPLHLDHNHITGKARGALCNLCNIGLGFFKDDVILLKKAISYLRRHSQL